MTWYTIKGLTQDGFDVFESIPICTNKREAVKEAQSRMYDREYLEAELNTVQVLDEDAVILWDAFV